MKLCFKILFGALPFLLNKTLAHQIANVGSPIQPPQREAPQAPLFSNSFATANGNRDQNGNSSQGLSAPIAVARGRGNSQQVLDPDQQDLEYVMRNSMNTAVPESNKHLQKRKVNGANPSVLLNLPINFSNQRFPVGAGQSPKCEPAWDKVIDSIVKNVYPDAKDVQEMVGKQLATFLNVIINRVYPWDMEEMLKPTQHSDAQDLSNEANEDHTKCTPITEANGPDFIISLVSRKFKSKTAGGRPVESKYTCSVEVKVADSTCTLFLKQEFKAEINNSPVQYGNRQTLVTISFPDVSTFAANNLETSNFASYDIKTVEEKISELNAGQIAVDVSVELVKCSVKIPEANELIMVQNVTAFDIHAAIKAEIQQNIVESTQITNSFKEQLKNTKNVTYIYEIQPEDSKFTFMSKITYELSVDAVDRFIRSLLSAASSFASEIVKNYLDALIESCQSQTVTNTGKGCQIVGYFINIMKDDNDDN